MDNFFLAQQFDWSVGGEKGGVIWALNKALQRLRIPLALRRSTSWRDMTNLEQRLNLWHLAAQPLAYGVKGDLIEFGCFDGKTATIFAKAIEAQAPDRTLHLFDHFNISFHLKETDIRQALYRNFSAAGCSKPTLHVGSFFDTVPAGVPDEIAFVHIDCGFGGDVEEHRATQLFLLRHIYPRMGRGAICALMDYWEPSSGKPDFNPGVGLAIQEFLADKPEECCLLWAGDYTHGFFRKL